jgi:hypothetical protein
LAVNHAARTAIAAPASPPVVLVEAALVNELQVQLRGRVQPDGKAGTPAASEPVVWTDAGDEVLVHRDSLRLLFAPGALGVAIDLETMETGRQNILVAIALAATAPVKKVPVPVPRVPPGRRASAVVVVPPVLEDPGVSGLFGVTEREATGDARLVARWGAILQGAVWSSLLAIATAHAAVQGRSPGGVAVDHLKRALYLFPARQAVEG